METLGKRRRLAGQMTLSAAVAGVALGATAALAGCSPTPITTYTPTPSVGASASPTVSPQAEPLTSEQLLALMPESAALPDAEGAIATAEFFLLEFRKMYETGNTAVWEALSLEQCQFCADQLESLREFVSRDGTKVGGDIILGEAPPEAVTSQETGHVYVKIRMHESPSTETYPSHPQLTYPQKIYDVFVELIFSERIWRVGGVSVESVG